MNVLVKKVPKGAFVAHSFDVEDAELPKVGSIISARVELVEKDDLPNLQEFEADQPAPDEDPRPPSSIPADDDCDSPRSNATSSSVSSGVRAKSTDHSAFVIERSSIDSPEVFTSYYGQSPQTLLYLQQMIEAVESPMLKAMFSEDLVLLQLIGSLGPSNDTSFGEGNEVGVRGLVYKKLKPLQAENAVMRKALGFKRGEKVTAISVADKIRPRTHSPAASVTTSKGVKFQKAGGTSMSTLPADQRRSLTSPLTAQGSSAPSPAHANQGQNVTATFNPKGSSQQHTGDAEQEEKYNLTADTTHSPLAWELETESAINARSRYDPYKRRRQAAGRQLDAITQQQLVSRLHDKSVDLRDKRRHDNEEKVLRELGRHERRILTPDEQHDLATRLHDKQREHTQEVKQKLTETYLRPLSPERHLTPEQQRSMGTRLHDVCMEKTKEDMKKLQDKYIFSKQLPHTRLKKSDQEAMADRLSKYHVRDYVNS